ncbi:MAG: hypothetical protein ACQEXC_09605 [Pseudomonadota bacterium]
MDTLTMEFIPPPLSCLWNINSISDFDGYTGGLVLIDDLLCKYSSDPRPPMYLPMNNGGLEAGSLELIEKGFYICLCEVQSVELKESLSSNFESAKHLYQKRNESSTEIQLFLASLLNHYSEIIHPAIYPGGR